MGGGGGWNPFDPIGSGLGLYSEGSGSPLPPSPLPGPPTLSGATGVGFPDADTVINTMTGGATNAFGLTKDTSDLSQFIGYTNPLSPAEQGLGYIMQGGDVYTGLDRTFDLPGSRTRKDKDGNEIPQGDIDWATRSAGKWANDVSGGMSGKVMNVVGPLVGGIVGGVVTAPTGGAGAIPGAMAGRAFADKWNQRSYEDTARNVAITGAISAATYGVGKGVDSLMATSATAPVLGSGYPTMGGLEGIQGLPAAQGAIQGSGYGAGLSSGFGNTGAAVGSLEGGMIDSAGNVIGSAEEGFANAGLNAAGQSAGQGAGAAAGEFTPDNVYTDPSTAGGAESMIPSGAITGEAPGFVKGIAKNTLQSAIMTPVKRLANELIPNPRPQARPQMAPQSLQPLQQPSWSQGSTAPLGYTAALDPEMEQTMPRYGAQSNTMAKLSSRDADIGSNSRFRVLKKLGVL